MAKLNLTRSGLKFLGLLILVIFGFLIDAALVVKTAAFAQDLTLFEDIEAPRGDTDTRGSIRNSAGDIISEPNFNLVGTARFGDHYSAVINNGNERNIRINGSSGSVVFIPGYPGYQVIRISSGQVVIKYPAERDCINSEDKGISCNEANIATLRLTNAEPIISPLTQREAEVASQSVQRSIGQNSPTNPFAALLEGASNSDASIEEANSFTPRRIDPEDVPSGMRIISTPFGDRLVEE